MKLKIKIITLMALAVVTTGAGPDRMVRVERVVSGDTVIVISKDKKETVRLLRIKTPDKDRPGHKEAADFLSGLVNGKTVSLQFEDPGKAERDSDGSIPAYIILDNKNINVEIVRAGWSRALKISGEDRYAEDFDKAQAEARAEKRGIWQVPADWPRLLKIGYFPQTESAKAAYPLIGEHVSRELNIDVEMVSMTNYEDVIIGLFNRTLEGGYLGPYSYIKATEIAGLEIVAMEVDKWGRRGYRSILIASNDSGIKKIEDARGKVLAFSDPGSTSGFLIPMLHFIQDLKETPASFAKEVIFAGSHRAVIEGVSKGAYSLGATNEDDLVRITQNLNLTPADFSVLWTSQTIPRGSFCIQKGMPESLRVAFSDALAGLKDETVLTGLNIGGFSPANDSEYDIVRKAKKYME